jgi:type IV pilus assembly protein PilW
MRKIEKLGGPLGWGGKTSEKGFTLIELMISIVLSIVIIGALLVLYTNGSNATKNTQAQGQMNEDAQMALAILTHEIRQAGYNPTRTGGAKNDLLQGGWAIFGCDKGFTDNAAAGNALTCGNAGTSSSIAVVYEGDLYSGKNTSAVPPLPMDCIGNGVSPTVGGGTYYTMQSRLFVEAGALRCLGGGDLGGTSQVLAENIESLNVTYGVAEPTVANSQKLAGYLTADEINNPTDAGLKAMISVDRWNKVVSARICIVVQSETAVLNDLKSAAVSPSYSNCSDTAVSIADGKLRRAYRTTVLLRNHGIGF